MRLIAQDAARYRYLRRKVAIAGGQFHFLNLPAPTFVAPSAAIELDAVLTAAIDREIEADDEAP